MFKFNNYMILYKFTFVENFESKVLWAISIWSHNPLTPIFLPVPYLLLGAWISPINHFASCSGGGGGGRSWGHLNRFPNHLQQYREPVHSIQKVGWLGYGFTHIPELPGPPEKLSIFAAAMGINETLALFVDCFLLEKDLFKFLGKFLYYQNQQNGSSKKKIAARACTFLAIKK